MISVPPWVVSQQFAHECHWWFGHSSETLPTQLLLHPENVKVQIFTLYIFLCLVTIGTDFPVPLNIEVTNRQWKLINNVQVELLIKTSFSVNISDPSMTEISFCYLQGHSFFWNKKTRKVIIYVHWRKCHSPRQRSARLLKGLLEGNKLKPAVHWPICCNQQPGFVCLLCKREK